VRNCAIVCSPYRQQSMERFRTHYLTTESAYASTNSGRVYMWMRNRAILCSRHGKRPLPNEDLGWLLQHCGHCGEQKVARSGLGRIRNIIPPKRRCWKEEQKIQVRVRFRTIFQVCEYSIWASNRRKVLRKHTRKGFVRHSKIFVWGSRRQLVPFFSTISISNISTKVSTTNPP
jgi:hypothetical protein